MTTIELLGFSGLILNIVGSLVLTFSLSKYLTAIHGALAIHDMQIKGIINRDEKLLSADIGNLLKIGIIDNRKKTLFGLIIVVIGFIVQLIPYLLALLNIETK